MRRVLSINTKWLTLLTLLFILLGGFSVRIVARAIWNLSHYPVRQAADLRRQLNVAHDLPVEKRVELETALLQYETDNQIKIWTAVVQGLGGAALLVGLFFTARNLQ